MDRWRRPSSARLSRLRLLSCFGSRRGFGPVGVFSCGSAVLALALLVGLSLTEAPGEAAFPGNNGRIVCEGARGPAAPASPPVGFSRNEVYTMNPDGSDVRVLTNNEVIDGDPVFSPDGTKIVFTSRRDSSTGELYIMNSDGTGVTRLTFSPGEDRSASFSPDGSRIAFDSPRSTEGRFDIYTMKVDGTDVRRLTMATGFVDEVRPAWSPDGSKISFSSDRDANEQYEIYEINPDGSSPRRVTGLAPDWDVRSHYAPDGRRMAFVSHRHGAVRPDGRRTGGNPEIYVINTDGSGERRLTTNGGDNTPQPPPVPGPNTALEDFPAWSPDGTKIIFDSGRDATEGPAETSRNTEVYSMNTDGTDQRRLTNNPGFDGNCDWERVRPAAVPPVYDVPKVTPPGSPRAGKSRTSMTLNVRPRRDRRLPFGFTFSGRVRIPAGVSQASVCGGRVRLVLKKGRRRTVARGTARVSRRCTYKKRITIRSAKRTGRRKAKLGVSARFGGNASLSSSRRSTTVRIF